MAFSNSGHTWLSSLPKSHKVCVCCGLKKLTKIIDGKATLIYIDTAGNEYFFPEIPKCNK